MYRLINSDDSCGKLDLIMIIVLIHYFNRVPTPQIKTRILYYPYPKPVYKIFKYWWTEFLK